MLGETRNNFRFCYFIDGLDESDGDNQSYRALINQDADQIVQHQRSQDHLLSSFPDKLLQVLANVSQNWDHPWLLLSRCPISPSLGPLSKITSVFASHSMFVPDPNYKHPQPLSHYK